MENKKRKVGGKLAAIFLMLMLVSCCFLASTFAKYTSAQTGTASTGVALWKVTNVSENSAPQTNTYTLNVDEISPNLEEKDVEIATTTIDITNESQVAAVITLEKETNAREYTMVTDSNKQAADIKAKVTVEGTEQEVTLDDVFVIKYEFKVGTDETWTEFGAEGAECKLDANGGKAQIKVTFTWLYKSNEMDTLIGMYVEKVSETFNVVATQASVLPTTNA